MMAMAMVLLWSCQEKEGLGVAAPGKVELAGSLTDGQILAGPDGGEFQINVTSSDDWRVSGLSEWVTVSSESGKSGQPLTFIVLPNDKPLKRTSTFKVFCADAVQAVTVVQSPVYSISLVSDDVVNVGSDASQIVVNVISNIEDIEVDYGGAESWISLSDVTDAFGKKIIRFDVDRSSEFMGRDAVLTLGGSDIKDKVEVTVNQAQRDTAFFEYDENKYVQGLEAMEVSFVLRSNVEVTYSLPSWLEHTEGEPTEKDETGLYSKTISFSAGAATGSRSVTIAFRSAGSTVGSFLLKQQNPNPVFVEIPDANLAYLLESSGWIIPDSGSQYEIVEGGINGTSLLVGQSNANAYGFDPIASLDGLEKFPNLQSLTLGSLELRKIDVSSFPSLNELNLINMNFITEINTGSRPITELTNVAGNQTYIRDVKEIVFKGDNIEKIDFSASTYNIDYEKVIESFDVTGCPKLKSLNVMRSNNWGESPLKYIYMTAAQAESVEVIKLDKVEIVVK